MKIFNNIEKIIWEDAGERNIIRFAPKNDLFNAAQSLMTAEQVVIVTGFYIEKMNTGETDGPLGAVFLAQSLEKLGTKVTLMTSPFNQNILQRAIDALQLDTHLIIVDEGEEAEIFPKILAYPSLTHLIAIEQMGTAIDGHYYNMAGIPIKHPMARFDSLFVLAREKGITTIGIGDGGNEIGMGNLFPYIFANNDKYWITNITRVDFLITAGVSNWGAYGLVAALSALFGQALLHDPVEEKRLLNVIIEAGAVDGKTHKYEMSVDGLPLIKHMDIIEKLHKVLKKHSKNSISQEEDSNVG